MTTRIITRFAPSPTGNLHLGHAYSAMLAHDHARAAGGTFVLRIEDTDTTRCKEEYRHAIIDDLAWLGLSWDGMIIQSARLSLYDKALEQLRQDGLVYPCFCSRRSIQEELLASLHAPHGADGPLYPGTCRSLAAATRTKRMETEQFSWRLNAVEAVARTGPIFWEDADEGRRPVDIAMLGDLVIKGRDRPASYHLAVVVDDAAQQITHAIRGRDLHAATNAHRILQSLLGFSTPIYVHHRLVCGADMERLAKRKNSPTIADLRAAGACPRTLMENMRNGRFPVGFALEPA